MSLRSGKCREVANRAENFIVAAPVWGRCAEHGQLALGLPGEGTHQDRIDLQRVGGGGDVPRCSRLRALTRIDPSARTARVSRKMCSGKPAIVVMFAPAAVAISVSWLVVAAWPDVMCLGGSSRALDRQPPAEVSRVLEGPDFEVMAA